jgi:hypothetical protein
MLNIMCYNSLYCINVQLLSCKYIVACFPRAGAVEARSLESGTQQKENELLCKARNSRKSSHASLVAMQRRSCGSWLPRNNSSRVSFSVRRALTNSATEFSVLSAPRLYNATLGTFAGS